MVRQRVASILLLTLLVLILAACGKASEVAEETLTTGYACRRERYTNDQHLNGTAVVPQKIERIVVLFAEHLSSHANDW